MKEFKFTVALTTYNRANILIPTIKSYEKYDEIDEIIVMDDCSDDYDKLIKEGFSDKVKIFRNETNIKAYQNKLKALEKASNEWIILFDSDNLFGADYIASLYEEYKQNGLDENTMYCPSEALPRFKYHNLENKIIDKNFWNNNHYAEGCFFNTGNTCLSKKAANCLIENFKADSIKNPYVECKYMCYILIKNGFTLKTLKGMSYEHANSDDGFYILNMQNHINFDTHFNWLL